MNYELIGAEDYDNLPDEPDLKFVELDRICRRNMAAMIDQNTSGEFDEMVRLQYMTTLAAAAAELGIPGIEYPKYEDYPVNKIADFMLAVSGAVTRIRLRAGSRHASFSVRLSVRTKGRIELQAQRLREIISTADMPEAKRTALLNKLDELLVELNQTRMSFANVSKILAAIGLGLGGTTAFLADAPQAIATIISLVGMDKEAEDIEVRRLGLDSPRKLLSPPQTAQAPVGEDDIPF